VDDRSCIAGSERVLLPGSRVIGDANPAEEATVTIYVRSRRNEAPPAGALSHAAFAEQYGADPADLQRVAAFARAHGLTVVESSAGRRSVILRGSVASLSAAFGVSLKQCEGDGVKYRGREGSITIPNDLADIVQAVLGLDTRPQAETRVRIAAAPAVSYTPLQVAKLYDFPANADGKGECVAIVELGGGFSQPDFSAYLAGLGVSAQTVTTVSVDGATQTPGTDSDADVEVMLDAEIVGAIAPNASIVMYFAPNTDQGFLDAVTTAVHDTAHNPSVVSISWGAPEADWTQQALDALNSAISAAAALGVTVCIASGDGGSSDGIDDGKLHADFPASSPYALGCGGTTLTASGDSISSEVAWSDSGGGVSDVFALPAFQSKAGVPAPPAGSKGGRGVPDVSGDADPNTGYQIRVDGQNMVAGGTSAVAPLWAAWIALANQQLGKRLGYLNASLYGLSGYPKEPGPIHDVTQGSNGAYRAGPGWDACTGLGSPDGSRLLQEL
jgi:kumamolisin